MTALRQMGDNDLKELGIPMVYFHSPASHIFEIMIVFVVSLCVFSYYLCSPATHPQIIYEVHVFRRSFWIWKKNHILSRRKLALVFIGGITITTKDKLRCMCRWYWKFMPHWLLLEAPLRAFTCEDFHHLTVPVFSQMSLFILFHLSTDIWYLGYLYEIARTNLNQENTWYLSNIVLT